MSSNSGSERIVADRYVLRRELGRGGMGVVWQAFDPTLDRDVAIKQVLLPDHFTDSERADAHGRVRREARSAARISHPTVITIHDVFEYDGNPWVVMELVEGGSLQDRLDERGALPPDEVAEIAGSLLRAVRAANAAGVLHRDIKPGNIMTSLDGRVILTDFGIATMEGGPSITRTGALIGSPEYMPPERLAGGPAEHRGDLWSIGVTLFAAVEGTSPFRRDSITAAIAAVMSAPLPPMTRAGWLEPVISGLLERDPDRRLSADEALALLRGRGGPNAGGDDSGGFGAAGAVGAAGAGAFADGSTPAFGSGPHTTPGVSGRQSPHHAQSGGHPGTGPRGGYPHTRTPLPQGPMTGPRPPRGGPSVPVTAATPFAHGHHTVHQHRPPHSAGGGHGGTGRGPGGPGGPGVPLHSGGHGGARPGSGNTRLLVGVGAAVVVLALIGGVAVVGATLFAGAEAEGGASEELSASESARPPAEPSASVGGDEAGVGNGGGEGQGEVGQTGGGDEDGEPPSYDELETFRSQWFHVDYPAGWQVDDSEIENTLAVFVAPGSDHQVWVTGWTEREFTGTSAEYLEDTNGGTKVEGDVTTGYTQLELEESDDGDFEEGWDVALVESDFVNETWASRERRFWAYAISTRHEGDRVFYLVSVNVPREDADYYDDLHEDVMETFDPRL
ncbi:serine/threonine protein kinase [Nocardiopsis dassonvillei]|uniref:serine/threonine-protein kinase n=1 Tax=Nocardiopsis dassonvillei TaxID=2014 RepID=UPI0020A26AC7|nr:serine/threonine-protein kinase [Nocardiopsis dassonvillei]MCP3015999.1 serine/threonine protein kinase [Nocardiopsis dassonvillei]